MPQPRPMTPRAVSGAPSVERFEAIGGEVPTVLYEAQGFLLTAWKNFAINVWSARATVAFAAKLDEHSATFVKSHPEGVSAIHIISANTPLPDADVREMLKKLTDKYAKSIACVSHVVEGSGFWASALHSFLTGLHYASRAPFELYIGSTVSAGARRLVEPHARRTGVKIKTEEIESVMSAARRRAGLA